MPAADILISELSDQGFESFVDTEDGFLAYISQSSWSDDLIKPLKEYVQPDVEIVWTQQQILHQNWNAVWESTFQPVRIGQICSIRAAFHPVPESGIVDLVIQPQMSFGTGHHPTTHLMVEYLMGLDLKNKVVMDMGCGTGILAILASIRGAKRVDAVDNDEDAVKNALENVQHNPMAHVNVYKGDHRWLKGKVYDLLIANINRNVLLDGLPAYVSSIKTGGSMVLSGFFETDIPLLRTRADELGLKAGSIRVQSEWALLEFNRN